MEKEKRKRESKRSIPKAVYIIVALALLMGILLGIGMNQTPPIEQEALTTHTPSPTIATGDSNTVNLPELQTQWAELDVTKTAILESNATPTPK